MAETPNDTTTTLNPGVGGDKMDESLVVQADGVTTAKRPRVELALSEDGVPQLVSESKPLPTMDEQVLQKLQEIIDNQTLTNDLLIKMLTGG